jgi:hypothetical protein
VEIVVGELGVEVGILEIWFHAFAFVKMPFYLL